MSLQETTAVNNIQLNAGWQMQQPDRFGSVYYFYPDGILVIQNPRRREFVRIGAWKINEHQNLVLFDLAPKSTTHSPEQLNQFREHQHVYAYTFDSDTQMSWINMENNSVSHLHRIKELPDRNTMRYWDFQNRSGENR